MADGQMLRPDVLLAILGMAIVTYASRAGGYALLRVVRQPRWLQAALRHLPGCLFVAYVAPPLLAGGLPSWVGALAVVGVQIASRNMGAAIITGIAVTWAVRLAAG
jgi:uncharacterized membrane protein